MDYINHRYYKSVITFFCFLLNRQVNFLQDTKQVFYLQTDTEKIKSELMTKTAESIHWVTEIKRQTFKYLLFSQKMAISGLSSDFIGWGSALPSFLQWCKWHFWVPFVNILVSTHQEVCQVTVFPQESHCFFSHKDYGSCRMGLLVGSPAVYGSPGSKQWVWIIAIFLLYATKRFKFR